MSSQNSQSSKCFDTLKQLVLTSNRQDQELLYMSCISYLTSGTYHHSCHVTSTRTTVESNSSPHSNFLLVKKYCNVCLLEHAVQDYIFHSLHPSQSSRRTPHQHKQMVDCRMTLVLKLLESVFTSLSFMNGKINV